MACIGDILKEMGINTVKERVVTYEKKKKMHEKLELLYGKERAAACLDKILGLINDFLNYKEQKNMPGLSQNEITPWVDESTVVLITYGDQIRENNVAPLKSLKGFLDRYLKGIISHVHILPFYPYTSDDGFSVTDYKKVNPELGSWGTSPN